MATVKKMSGTVEVPDEVIEEVLVVEVPEDVKYRKDFKSWEEYNNYNGPKA